MSDIPRIDSIGLPELVNRLFEISLAISALNGLVDGSKTERVRGAVDKLDGLIQDVRRAAFGGLRGGGSDPVATRSEASAPLPGTLSYGILLRLLRETSLSLDGLLHSALARSDAVAVDLTEASQAVHRALVTLALQDADDGRVVGRHPSSSVEEGLGRPFHVEVEYEPGVQVLRLNGNSDGADVNALRALFASFGEIPVRLDLRGLTFMDRSVLQAVVDAKRQREQQGFDCTVIGMTGVVRRLSEALGVTGLL
jgi:anti-anti-sigma regulatory factor